VIRPPPQPVELRRICDVQGQRRDALIGVNQRPACIGIHPLCASPQGFLDQRLPETRLAPVTRTALPSIVIAFVLMTASLSCESLLLVEGLGSTRRRSREGDLDRRQGVGCERRQARRANVVWTRRLVESQPAPTRARRPRPHLLGSAAERGGLALRSPRGTPTSRRCADPLGAARPVNSAGSAGRCPTSAACSEVMMRAA
jgi:hypothetical protein